jgi:hypothetical protein
METSGFLNHIQLMIMAARAPPRRPGCGDGHVGYHGSLPLRLEAGLKPYQPNQRRKTPSMAKVRLWPGKP